MRNDDIHMDIKEMGCENWRKYKLPVASFLQWQNSPLS